MRSVWPVRCTLNVARRQAKWRKPWVDRSLQWSACSARGGIPSQWAARPVCPLPSFSADARPRPGRRRVPRRDRRLSARLCEGKSTPCGCQGPSLGQCSYVFLSFKSGGSGPRGASRRGWRNEGGAVVPPMVLARLSVATRKAVRGRVGMDGDGVKQLLC